MNDRFIFCQQVMNETTRGARDDLSGGFVEMTFSGTQVGSSTLSSSPAGDPWATLDAVAQAEMVRVGQVSALELVDAAIARIDRLDPVVHALAAEGFEQARARARGPLTGPLAGVPFLVKDLLPYPGMPCAFGSRMLKGQPSPPAPDYSVALAESGLIALGKSTTSEFGLLGTTEPCGGAPTLNPWDRSRSPAGSSGGSAAAVASGMVSLAHASDGGGSIRIPASVCGLFGFKPSRGRNRAGAMGDGRSVTDLLIEHCVSRSVRDSATLLTVTQRTGADAPFLPIQATRSPGKRALRIALVERTLFGLAPQAEVADALAGARRLCESLGHTVIEAAGPVVDAPAVSAGFFLLCGLGLAATFGPLLQQPGSMVRQALEPFTCALIDRAVGQPASAMAEISSSFEQASRATLEFLAGYDAVLCPTIPFLPFELGRLTPELPPDEIIRFTEALAGYTSIYSLAGAPAMSVPLHWTAGGLPVGSQFVAAPGQETLLFDLAYALEEAAPWSHRWPSFA